jgi:hypothetical protein
VLRFQLGEFDREWRVVVSDRPARPAAAATGLPSARDHGGCHCPFVPAQRSGASDANGAKMEDFEQVPMHFPMLAGASPIQQGKFKLGPARERRRIARILSSSLR